MWSMWKIVQKKIISYPSLFNKSWTNGIIKTETKKWKLGITTGMVYRPNQIVEKLILIQEHTLRTLGRSTTRPSGTPNLNNRLPGM